MFGAREKKSKRARTLSKISKLSTDSGVEEEDEEKSDSDEVRFTFILRVSLIEEYSPLSACHKIIAKQL